MIYDYSKLKGRIIEKCGSQNAFAKAMGLSERSISLRLNNRLYFKQSEIDDALKILELDDCDIMPYFFTKAVQRN